MTPRLTPQNALLFLVDVQERLWPVMHDAPRVVANLVRLAKVARRLQLPVVVSEQNPARLGPTCAALRDALGEFAPVEKLRFSAFHDAQSQLAASGRCTVLLCGLEAHICVTQTALDLLDEGFTVFAARDAISSREAANVAVGWERMGSAGALSTSTEAAIYELLGAAGSDDFRAVLPWIK